MANYNYIDAKKILHALSPESPGGEKLSAEEYAQVVPGYWEAPDKVIVEEKAGEFATAFCDAEKKKSVKLDYVETEKLIKDIFGELNLTQLMLNRLIEAIHKSNKTDGARLACEADIKKMLIEVLTDNIDRQRMDELASIVNSVEADGSRISENEIRSSAFFKDNQKFFDVLQIEAKRQNVSIFSPDHGVALEKIVSDDMTWFDIYQKLLEAGFNNVTFANAHNLENDAKVFGHELLSETGFWEFVSDYVVPHYFTYSEKVHFAGLFQEAFFGVGLLSLYNKHSRIMRDSRFISFAESISHNYVGVNVVDDITYFVELYNDPSRLEAVLSKNNCEKARRLTEYIPISGALEQSDFDKIEPFINSVDLKEAGRFVANVNQALKLSRNSVRLEDLPLVLELYNDPKMQRLITSGKLGRYADLMRGRISIYPRNWRDLVVFVQNVLLLPDDATIFSSAISLIERYGCVYSVHIGNGEVKFEADTVLKALVTLNRSVVVRDLLAVYRIKNKINEKYPVTLYLDDLLGLAKLDVHPDSPEWLKFDSMLQEGEGGLRSLPVYVLVYLAEHPVERAATLKLFKDMPELFADYGLGISGMARAPELVGLVENITMEQV
ncbi:MAG: hypothetical protein V2B20_01605 [Pseudomonadota bacterium]